MGMEIVGAAIVMGAIESDALGANVMGEKE
jgi:hypothetical protein